MKNKVHYSKNNCEITTDRDGINITIGDHVGHDGYVLPVVVQSGEAIKIAAAILQAANVKPDVFPYNEEEQVKVSAAIYELTEAAELANDHLPDPEEWLLPIINKLGALTNAAVRGEMIEPHIEGAEETYDNILEESPFMTEDDVIAEWEGYPLQNLINYYGADDTVALDEGFNNWTDMLCKEGRITTRLYESITRPEK